MALLNVYGEDETKRFSILATLSPDCVFLLLDSAYPATASTRNPRLLQSCYSLKVHRLYFVYLPQGIS